jgi:hypothetical protein
MKTFLLLISIFIIFVDAIIIIITILYYLFMEMEVIFIIRGQHLSYIRE